jgi:hypothetical protein
MEHPAVERAEYRANLFGRGVLELTYRRPVASVANTEGLYLSSRGALFQWPDPVGLKVTVEPPFDLDGQNLAVFGSWRSGTAALMCENVGERLPDMEWRLVVSRTGFVSLVPTSGGTVEFGSFDGAEGKVQTLVNILRDDPGLLTRVRELNLSSTKPVFVP